MIKNLIKDILIFIVISVGCFLMLKTIVGYASFNTTYAFLLKKQEYLSNKGWLTAFYIHVFTSIFTLIAGCTQFSNAVLLYYKSWHRNVGKIYIVAVIFINVPSGFIMAIYANGGITSKLAFLILDILWFYFTLKAWQLAKQKKFKLHKEFMIRSFALTFSAITLRTWKIILLPIIKDENLIYMIDAWLGFVPNLLFAEWLIRRKH